MILGFFFFLHFYHSQYTKNKILLYEMWIDFFVEKQDQKSLDAVEGKTHMT